MTDLTSLTLAEARKGLASKTFTSRFAAALASPSASAAFATASVSSSFASASRPSCSP